MTTTVRILGSRAREQVPGTSITLLAPGFRGSLAQLAAGSGGTAAHDLPFAEAAAGADAMAATHLTLQLEAAPVVGVPSLRSRSAMVSRPRVIVPRRAGVAYALLQTDETGASSFLSPSPGDRTEAVFPLTVAARGSTRRTLRVLMWPELSSTGPGSLAMAARWERLRRPHQISQLGTHGQWHVPDGTVLATGPILLLLHDTFSTPQSTFAEWIGDPSFEAVLRRYAGRCLAFTHPTLAASLDANLEWLVSQLAGIPGPFDIVAHGRGGLLARALAVDGRLPLRRVCQVGTPNHGTPLAQESHLPRFLDAHVAMLATAPHGAALGVLEGALCVARCLAQGLRAALPGVEALTPDSAPLIAMTDVRQPGLEWFTIGAQFCAPEGHAPVFHEADEFSAIANDLVVPTQGCHEPGVPVHESLHLSGSAVHHHNYFASRDVQDRLGTWFG